MALYPIRYFEDKDYDMPEIAIFHSHYPKINVQYAEISFKHCVNGAEFQVMNCSGEYLIFVLNTINNIFFNGWEERKEEVLQERKRVKMNENRPWEKRK